MRKFTGILLVIIAAGLIIWKVSPFIKSNKNKVTSFHTGILIKDNDSKSEDEEDEDGIFETQKHEFEITRDPTLNIIPKSRLINAYQSIMERRRLQRPGDISALSWVERGPYTDVVGPGNGNTRQGNGVTSGRLRAILVDKGDASNHTVWVGAIAGGLWKTNNISSAPATWTLVSDNFSNMAVSAICQDPANVNIMYFGTGEKTINSDKVKGGGIWKSIDHGLTWNFLSSTASYYNVSKMTVDNAGNVYVSTIGSGNGLMRSTDGGTSWTKISPSGLTSDITEMELSSTGRMHIVAGYYNTAFASAGYRYTDDPATVTSATWTSSSAPFSSTQFNVDLAVAGNTLYALPANSSFQTPLVYKSTDGGDTWLVTSGNPGSTVSSGQGWYCTAIAVDPANDQNVVIGGLNMFRTTDGGTTWIQISNWYGPGLSYVHADQQTAVWTGNQVLVGSDGGIHYSNDGGATFLDRNIGLRIKQFYSVAMHPTNYNYFLAGAQDNGVHKLNAAGLTSSVEVTGGDGAFVAIDQDQPQYQFGSYVYNQYRRSTDGGNSWSAVNYSDVIGSFINPFDYDDAANKMYAAGNSNQYLRWENPQTGSTFTPITLSELNGKISTVQVSPYTPNRVYFGSKSGRVVKVDNADGNLSVATDISGSSMPTYNASCIAVGTDDNNLMAVYSNYGVAHIWVTTTGGGLSAWTNVSGNLPDIPVRWALFYPEDNTKAIIATEAGIFETNQINGSSTVWTQNASFPFVRTDMLKYRAADGTVAAATHGRGIWTVVIPKTIPYIRFASTIAGATETTTGTDGCRNFTDFTSKLNIDLAPTGSATLTLKAEPASSAKEGSDFEFTTNGSFSAPSKTIVFANGSTTSQTFTVRIYDDAEVESGENFIISYTITGITDAIAAPSAKTLTYTITDNDKAPDQGGTSNLYTVGSYSYYLTATGSNEVPFNSQLQSRRNLMLYKASELTAAGIPAGSITSIAYQIIKNSTRPYNNMLIKMGTTSVNYIVDGATELNNFSTTIVKTLASYSTKNGSNAFTLDNPFEWNGTDNIIIEICYDNTTADLSQIQDRTIGYNDGGTTSQGNLYWQDDIPCGSPFNTDFTNTFGYGKKPMIDMTVSDAGNPIATSGSNTIYIGGPGSNYFFTGTNIIASLSNQSASLGCVAASFNETGNVWQSFSSGMRSQKVFSIEPSTNINSSYIVGLYYTTAELAGKLPGDLKIAKTNAASIAGADGSNTIIGNTTYATYKNGYIFYAPFTGFSKFFLVDGSVALPVTLLSFDGTLSGNTIQLNWKTSSERNSKYFEVQKSGDGNSFVALGKINAAGTSSIERRYSFVDQGPSEVNYYRLKMVDADGRSLTSKTILIKKSNNTQLLWIGKNPFHDQLEIHLAKTPPKPIMVELISMNGSKVYSKVFGVATSINLDLSNSKISSGIYLLKVQVDGIVYSHKVIKE